MAGRLSVLLVHTSRIRKFTSFDIEYLSQILKKPTGRANLCGETIRKMAKTIFASLKYRRATVVFLTLESQLRRSQVRDPIPPKQFRHICSSGPHKKCPY
ncbi:hypothetical protein AVEN_274891-1 [Araneus ventricosus]|uniref:Uncharacterized protein n=1 Tax=Araneus ventricosus TaxID=182803 RepID=A0A4Y2XAZ7_ARAVE|nr:hypothetical protein AVEN_274891-1 [Araneus ventricosus]